MNLARYCAPTGVAIDIGASVGWYTYPLSKRFSRVYAFEINDEVTRWITDYNRGNIEVIHCGLSCKEGNARLYVPVAHGLTLTGWGSLYQDNCPNADKYLEKEVQVAPLDDFKIADVGFVKMDVEGHEVEVLLGAERTISQSRPVILIEIKDRNLQLVGSWFQALSYRRFTLEELIGVHGQLENYIYIPNEKLTESGVDR